MEKAFSIGEALGFGWKSFKESMGLWIGVTLVIVLGNIVLGSLGTSFDPATGVRSGSPIADLLSWLIGIVLTIGMITLAVKTVRAQKTSFSDLFTSCDSLKKFFFMLIGQLLYGIVVGIGLVFLVVPGLIAATMFYLTPYFIAVENKGPIEAMKLSMEKTKGHKMQIFLLILASAGIMILGALALGVGLLVALPVVIIASAYVYNKLTGTAADGMKNAEILDDKPQDVLDPVMTTEGK